MSDIEIEYCVPCGHLDRAIDTQRAILEQFGTRIDGVALKTGTGGVFTIRAGEETLYDKSMTFDLDALLNDIEARV